MTENIKTTISTGKNTFDAKGDFLHCGNYYYKIVNVSKRYFCITLCLENISDLRKIFSGNNSVYNFILDHVGVQLL